MPVEILKILKIYKILVFLSPKYFSISISLFSRILIKKVES